MCFRRKGSMFFTEQVGTSRSHVDIHRVQTVVPMANLVLQDPQAHVRPKTLISAPIFLVLAEVGSSCRDGGLSTDQTVINTDGAPTRPTAEIPSCVKRFTVHSRSHTKKKNTTAPRPKRPNYRSYTGGDANEARHWRRLPRTPLHSVCRGRRCGECGIWPR